MSINPPVVVAGRLVRQDVRHGQQRAGRQAALDLRGAQAATRQGLLTDSLSQLMACC